MALNDILEKVDGLSVGVGSDLQGRSVMDALKRVGNVANSSEGAGVIGGVVVGTSTPTCVTGLGGFGITAAAPHLGLLGWPVLRRQQAE